MVSVKSCVKLLVLSSLTGVALTSTPAMIITEISQAYATVWGTITGTLSDQTDVQSSLDGKQAGDADLTDLADGSLAGSKVGDGVPAANIAAGTIDVDVVISSAALATFYSSNLVRTNLGLSIGSNVQAWDANLDDLADGSLTGSKVGSGVPAENIASGDLGALVKTSSAAANSIGSLQILDGSIMNADVNASAAIDDTKLAQIATVGKVATTALDTSSVTKQGNTFNGASQLVKLQSDGKLPAVDGSLLTNLPGGGDMVLATAQTVTGPKTFQSTTTLAGPVIDEYGSYGAVNYSALVSSGSHSASWRPIAYFNAVYATSATTVVGLGYAQTELSFPVIAGSTYTFRFEMRHQCSSTGGIRYGVFDFWKHDSGGDRRQLGDCRYPQRFCRIQHHGLGDGLHDPSRLR